MKFTMLRFWIIGQCNKWFQGLAKFCNFKAYREIKSKIVMAKVAFNKKKKKLITSKLDLNLRKKLVKLYICSIAVCGAAT